MADQQPSMRDLAKYYAGVKLNDHFGSSNVNVLNFLSTSIAFHLNDYFILTRDLSFTLKEEFRRCYFDYSFAVVPVHKAFECYLSNILTLIFGYEVSKNPRKSIGFYLGISNSEKNKKLEQIEKDNDLKLNKKDWVARWNVLSDQWKKNRNPLTHSDEERIGTLTQAEQVANSLMREISLSLKLFIDEYLDPVFTKIKEQEDKRLATQKEKDKIALEILKKRASGI